MGTSHPSQRLFSHQSFSSACITIPPRVRIFPMFRGSKPYGNLSAKLNDYCVYSTFRIKYSAR